jgi:outer membrane protein insertion porin family
MRGFREDGLISADRRAELAGDLNACQAVANKAGCTQDAKALLDGIELASEGGQLFTLGRAELRFPVFRAFDLGLFAEAGNLWFDTRNYRPLELRYVVGTGLRYGTPIGPLAFDVGFNPFPDWLVNEPAFNLNFSIGLF